MMLRWGSCGVYGGRGHLGNHVNVLWHDGHMRTEQDRLLQTAPLA